MRKVYSIFSVCLFSLFAFNANSQDCDYNQSSLLFDMDECKAIFGFPSQTEYNEFTAIADTFPGGPILSVVGGNLYRENGAVNMHSCTESYDESTAMCVSSEESCDYVAGSDKAVRFDIKVELGSDGVGRLSGLCFNEAAPEMFNWLNGSSGPNNYPTKYAVRVLVNGSTVFEEIDIETSNDWTKETFDFSDIPAFRVTEMTVFNFELLPYCQVGIDSPVNAWDLDNIIVTANEIDNASGGTLTFGDGTTEKDICIGDGNADNMNVNSTGVYGTSKYLITDASGVIIAYDVTFPFDFESGVEGTCLIWNIGYYDSITGTDVGSNAADIEGCYDLSNPITLVRNQVAGGNITGGPFEFCVGDDVADNINAGAITLNGNIGANGQWVVTTDQGVILGLFDNYTDVNFDGAGAGTCLVWYLSYEDGLLGATVGANASDLNGCYDLSNSIAVIRNERPEVNINPTATMCGEDNGAATAIGSNGQAPYTYAWSNGQSGSSISDLAPGNYTVTITDANGCTNTTSGTIGNSSSPTASASSTATTCGENNGTATASATSGTAPYTYVWSNGSTTSMINSLSSGDYTVTVTDAVGCTDVSMTSIDASSKPVLTATSFDTTCGDDNGAVMVSAMSGIAPYTYAWSNGGSSASMSGLDDGTYTVTVTDAVGCTESASTVIDESSSPTVSTSSTDTTCGEDNGTATATTTGGVGPYSYLWSNDATVGGGSCGDCIQTVLVPVGGQDPIIVEEVMVDGAVLALPNYPYDLQDQAQAAQFLMDCLALGYNIEEEYNEETGNVSISVLYPGQDFDSFNINGGEEFYFTCTECTGTDLANATITALAAGSYTVTVTDAAGCTSTSTTVVGDSTSPIVDTSSTATSCGEDNGTATATTTSGVAPYTYTWSNGSSTSMLNNLSSGDYTVTVTDAAGCTDVSMTVVGASSSPQATASSVDTSCGENNGTASVTAMSGTAPYTYAWSNGGSSASISGLNGGTYTVTVTDAAGCITTASTSVAGSTSPIASTSSTDTTCGEDNGTASATSTSGVAPYTYVWSNGSSNASMTGIAAGSYTVTVTDSEGCTSTSTTVVGDSTSPIVNTSSTDTTCGEDNGTATATATSGVAPYTYAWSNGSSTSMLNNLSSGDYTVTVTDAVGCTDVSMTSVGSSNAPQASATSTDTSCGEANGTAGVSATSGTAPYTYAWSNGGNTSSITGLSGGTYTATVTDAVGCIVTASTTIEGSTSPIASSSAMATTCGEDNGTANATATSGVAPYTYAWSNGGNSASISGLAAGSYTVTATDSEGCTSTSTTSVGNSTSPNVSASSTATSCGEDNGTATASTTSGTAPYTYAWSNGSTTSMINNLSSGDYNVTVTDAAGCTDVSMTSVSSSNAPQATATSSDTSCGENNGTASVTATSGTAPYTYAWSNGGSSASITGLSGGTYTVTVTDAAGCIATASTTIEGSTSPIANTSAMATTCGEDNGTANATTTSGVAPYTYAWSNGANSASITGLAAGSYTVTATDSEGCTSTSTTTVGDSSSPNVTASATATSCGENNGTATASTTSGTAPYTYAWSNGSTTSMINNLSSGDYNVTVTDAAGCTDVSMTSVSSSNSPQATATSSDTSCGENNGTVSVTATSGTMPYTYAWSNGGSSASITGLSGGTYTATVTDAAGCISTASTTIEGSTSPIVNTSAMATTCGEDNGTASATATSGVAPYSYAWSTGSSNASLTGLAAGSYTVTATDSEGCTTTSTTSVGDSTSPNVNASATATSCGENNGTATATTTSGTAPYTYAWSTGSTTSMINNLSSGDYNVTVTDAAGCTDVSSTTVTSSNSPQASATSSDTSCGENNGTASVTATSGTAPYSYAWSNGGSSASITGLSGGTYTATVTDAAGCISTASTTVEGSTSPIANTSSMATTCGENNGTATATATSGVAPYTYAWSNGSSIASLTGLTAGSYTVTITDSEGCTSTSTTTVGDSTSPNVTASATATSCGENNGTATASTTSGTAPYTYVWSTGSTTSMINNLSAVDYTVTVTDAAGCTDVSTASVTSSNSPQASATSSDTSCGENNGTASVTATSGTAPYTYTWSNGGSTASITGLSGGTYTATVTDAAGCISTASTTVEGSTSPLANTSAMATSCGEDNGTATATATSGVAPYTYAWSNGSSNASMSGLAAGSYTVTITDSEGCTSTSTTTVGDSTSPNVTTSSTATSCGENNATATASTTSGTAPYTYVWSTGSTTSMLNNLSAGDYTVTVTDAAGCTDVSTASVTSSNSPQANATSTDTSCGENNGTASVTATSGTGPYTYGWSNGGSSASISGLTPGSYTVTVTDAAGCIVTANTTIGSSIEALVTTSATDTTCGEDTGSASATGTSGVAPFTYAWSNGSSNASVTGLAAGSYTVTVTDSEGCTDSSTTTVGDSSSPNVTATATSTSCGENNGTVTASTTSGTAPYTYVWSNGSTTAMLNNLATSDYTVTVTDAAGCTDVFSTTVTSSNSPQVTAASTATSCGENNGTASVTATSGIAPYTYAWSNGGTSASITGLSNGSYTVTVTDAAGCIATATTNVGASTSPIASTSGMATTCGENNGIATASATSGTAPYTYSWSNGSSNASITGLAAGSYTVTITDSEGCTGVSSISINDSNSPIASAISSGTTCGSNNGTATASATSGTAPYTYAWSNGLSGATQSGLSAGAYSVTVTDAAGCTGVATATVTNSNPISANMSSTDTTCAEDNGTATAQGANGTAPYTYVWFNGSNNNSVSGLSTGTYSVTITDAIGCTVVGSTAVEDSSSPTVTTNSTNTTCGENNGGATATGTQGTAPYTYLWSNGSTNQNISNLAAGTYSVTMTDAIGCVATGTSVVSGSMNVVANAISTETTCGMNTGTATASATNGTAPYTYLWSTSATTQTITNLTAGTYTVTVTDAVGCTDAASVVVEGSSNPSIVVGSAPEICGMMDGVVTVSISNGMAPYQVIWSNGSTEETQTGLAGGTYSVTVTDSKGCTATGSIGVEGSITPDGGVINEEGETAIEYCIEGTMDMLTELNLTNEVGTNMTWIITSETGTIQHILDYDGIAGFDFDDQNIGTCLIYHLSYEDIMNLSVGSNISTFSGCYDLSNPITLTKYGLADYSESSLLIDMDMCAADGTTNEANDYSEFTATIDNDSNCATLSVVGGNLYRDNPSINGHSCTEGVDGSVAMCVSSDAGCDYNPSSDKAIKLDIEIVPASNGSSRLTELSFFEKAPEVFSWIDGNAGPNNYPTRFGVRVLKGTEVVFQQSGLTTLREWNERTFTFSGDDFLVTETTTFTVELLAYCIIDNGFPVTAWDIDDLMLVTECDNVIEEGTFTGGPYEICLDGIPDFITDLTLEGAEGAIVKLVLVDESNSIIANFDDLAEFATLDFESLTAGTCTLYAISAGVGFTGCEVGNTLKFDFEGCYKLSNPVTFTKMACGTLVGTYPNPTNSKVTISNMHTMKGDKTVTIYNARGKVVRSYNVSSGIVNDEVDLSEYTAGLYMIQIITTGGHKITKSVMKVKN